MAIVDVASNVSGSGGGRDSGRASGKGAVYRILPDGVWDISVDVSGRHAVRRARSIATAALLVATGSKGKIYRVAGEPERRSLVARAAAQQVTSSCRSPREGYSSRPRIPASCSACRRRTATSGSYESDVRDAETVATWGAISWRRRRAGRRRVKLYTRSGNTPAPDDTWSPWSAAYRKRRGRADHQPEGALPAVESGSDRPHGPSPCHVGDRRLPAAQPAAGDHVDHDPSSGRRVPEAVLDRRSRDRRLSTARRSRTRCRHAARSDGAPPLGRRGYQKGLQTFIWKADDDNDDELSTTCSIAAKARPRGRH